jgi:DNA-binding transcriptional LysR family regulator
MSDLVLRHLAALGAVVEEGSFARAAARLGYTQSTVSQQIAALEQAVGGAVFDRPGGPKPVRLTPLGAVVLAHGRELLARAETMTAAIDRFKAGGGRVDIGTFQSVSNVILPLLVQRLRREHPDCDIRLFEEETDSPRLDELDLMFFDSRVGGDVEHRKLLDDPFLLVARPGDFPHDVVPVTHLDRVPIVAHPPICDQARVERTVEQRGIRLRIVFRSVGNDTLLSMVRAGMGAAVLPRLIVRGAGAHSDPALRVHRLDPPIAPREIFLLWQQGRTHSPLAARTIELATAVAREVAHDSS